MVDRFAILLVRSRWTLLACAVLASLLAIGPSNSLRFEESIESLYPADDPYLLAYQRSKRDFGGDEIIVIALPMDEVLDEEGSLTRSAKTRLRELSDQLQQIPGIDAPSVQTIVDALRIPYARAKVREFVDGVLLSRDGKTATLVARLLPVDQAPVSRTETFVQVRQLAAQAQPPGVVVGEPIQVHDMFRYVEHDGSVLGWATSGLLMLVILILFRSIRWMVLPVAIVQASLLWTRGLLAISGLQLSMVSSMLDALVMILGIATAMHLTLRYRQFAQSLPREEAMIKTLQDLLSPIFWAVVTTMVGFASLMTSNVVPISSFGLMMTLASGLVLVATLTIAPGLILLGRTTVAPGAAPGEEFASRLLDGITRRVLAAPLITSAIMLVSGAVCALGLIDLQVETDFSKNFRSSSPIVQALDVFETRLGGAGTWEVRFPVPNPLDEETVGKVREVTSELRSLEQRTDGPQLTKVISVTDGLELIPQRILLARIPLERRLDLLDTIQPDFLKSLYNRQSGQMRILLRAHERQSAERKLRLMNEVETITRQQFPAAEVTGLFVLLSLIIKSLLGDQLVSFVLSLGLNFASIMIAFRRFLLGVLLMLPNLFPIAVVIGSLGLLGLPLNIGTAMIASVSLGLTIDSSIHYVHDYLMARRAGASFDEAIHATHQGTGLALVFSNIALVIGFSVLSLSQFVPLIYFGLLVSVALIGGLVGNLVLLPLVLKATERIRGISPEGCVQDAGAAFPASASEPQAVPATANSSAAQAVPANSAADQAATSPAWPGPSTLDGEGRDQPAPPAGAPTS